MLNFTVGPVMSSEEVLSIGSNQVPYFRTEEFSKIMLENEELFLDFAGAPQESRAVFITGSGTAAMEAAVAGVLTPKDKVLIVVGGSFGRRFSQLCDIYKIPHDDIQVEFGQSLTPENLARYNFQEYSALLVNIHETSTGVLYDASMLSAFCKQNGMIFIMDAISAFLADPLDMEELGVDVFITGSQKALACPPGVSLIALSPKALNRIDTNEPKGMYLDLKSALDNGRRGQTPFTPAVGTLLQINARLKQIKRMGGVAAERQKIAALAEDFRAKIKDLPFTVISPSPSNAVTVLAPRNVSAHEVFLYLKDNYNIWVCPNGGDLADKIFRVGHIGALSKNDNDKLIDALKDMQTKGLL